MDVSVIMATFNGERYIRDQIESILCQMSESDELIISDDGSNDNTVNIIKEYMNIDGRLKLLKGPQSGYVKNFENALVHTHNSIIMFSDQDDIWLPNKFEEIINCFESNPTALLVAHNLYIATNEEIAEHNYIKKFDECRKHVHGVLPNIIYSAYFGCAMAFRRELKEIVLPFPTNLPMHDQWVACIAEYTSKCYYIDKPLIVHREHCSSTSNPMPIKDKINSRIIMYHLVYQRIKEIKHKRYTRGD
jgi:glycosyltransferase involved in cell wall biosynthesis